MDGISEGRGAWRSRYPLLRLSPPIEEEEDSATRVVVGNHGDGGNNGKSEVVEKVVLDPDEFAKLADAIVGKTTITTNNDGTPRAQEMDFEITDDDESAVGDDSDSAVGGTGLKRRRTIRVIIRSRAFL